MAQAAAMGPPLSPKEIRRSGRRSIPSASTSASKSPDLDPAPKQKEIIHRPALASNNSNGRQKRLKQEDFDELVDDRKNASAPSTSSMSSTHGAPISGRTKRKPKEKEKEKEKDKQPVMEVIVSEAVPGQADSAVINGTEEEEQGITRCICGSTGEDDPDAGEFMVQCETCKVWQHGLCMGFESEDQLHDDDYYCEICKPTMHAELLKRLSNKRPRQTSTTSIQNPTSAPSRVSRSHSPSTLMKQPSKRRNTMNSRDAAFDESLKEIIEATAAEAAAVHDTASVTSTGNRDFNDQHDLDEDIESGAGNRKKRKRNEDDSAVKKRTRSASSASDHQGSTVARDDTPGQSKPPPSVPAPPSKPSGRTNKRGGRKSATVSLALDPVALMEGSEEVLPQSSGKRQALSNRVKGSNVPKRPPVSHSASHGPASSNHEHGTRRNQPSGTVGSNAGSTVAESSRAYRNSHAYVVSQQPLFTSWNLPDYLSHLQHMLPSDAPRPLEVRTGPGLSAGMSGKGETLEVTLERGVKVKWPSKRMSVGDMNKRVRALVDWVAREQATALDRSRRRDALERALKEDPKSGERDSQGKHVGDCSGDIDMALDGDNMAESLLQAKVVARSVDETRVSRTPTLVHAPDLDDPESGETMKKMEALMEQLIDFQEQFGPGSRNRERERRLVSC
ncbi:hypothetical protein BDZ94DRAFT_1255182 [Collybia nuda]|uniref:PHD-type domain-containing protein n=1 Tax=Collybia nuda TaxID=64659 RepID=A0A9P5Y7L9_9AGAR|nr:hypothetical protein BDZ94DRAFT_1255182 [Collybia nuda]